MKVLFFMRSTVYVRNFESTLRLLAERGHDVHVVADAHRRLDPTDLIGRLSRDYPRIRYSPAIARRANRWSMLGLELRGALDYLRYLRPEYRDAPKLRRRAELKAPAFVTAALRRPLVNTRAGRWLLGRILRWCDGVVPRDPDVDAFVREHRPDLVLVTPLVEPGSPQSEYVRSARAHGIRTGLCVYSWDNLTNKGLIHDRLDLVTVWNEPMKQEAVSFHRVPPARVVVTGAAPYDHWFGWKPRTTREGFCARVGLEARHPYLLYLCSSKFIAPDELPFVRQWMQNIRAASPTLRDVGVLVRPHPQNTDAWRAADLGDLGNVAIWPRAGENPVDEDSRADYYDSIHHSAAVVGVNTSAQIESAIVGRGVYTLLAPEFSETQDGTLHFRHLREVNGGLLHVASTIEEHVAQLEEAVRNPDAAAEKCRRFIGAFVRPFGIEEAATPRLVAALEATAGQGRTRPERPRVLAALVRPVLARAAAAVAEQRNAHAAHDKESGKQQKKERRAAKSAAGAADTGAGSSEAFARYLHVRECARSLKEAESATDALTSSEQQIASALEPLWDAGPETIAHLRHHCKVISGVRRSNYRGPRAAAVRARLERDLLRLLEKGDPRLWIEEPAALGGFGFNGSGKLFNEDTLRFFRVLSLFEDAALLKQFRDAGPRRTVWEIGGGWGGFAYQFKTVCPGVTYLMTGTPELLLLSATYLTTLFPDARFRFYEHARPQAFFDDWDTVDFAFAPQNVVATMRPPTLDLTIDLETLERMSPDRIGVHVQRAYDLGCHYFFSICPSGDSDQQVASPVRPVVERLYWPHAVSAPTYLDRRLVVRGGKTYLLGWRRLRV